MSIQLTEQEIMHAAKATGGGFHSIPPYRLMRFADKITEIVTEKVKKIADEVLPNDEPTPDNDDIFMYPDGDWYYRIEVDCGAASHKSDDYQVIYFGSKAHEELFNL